MKRIVSLISSATEIVNALGFDSSIVGRSHECDYPESIRSLPICTEIKLNPGLSSYAIDQRVKAIVQEGLSVYRVKAELLRTLKPDLVITQTQCEVCAVSEKDVDDALCSWMGDRPEILSLRPNALADLWEDIRRVARALDAVERGEALVARLRERMREEKTRVSSAERKPRVACIEWIDPLMAAGNWVPELIEMAGGENLFGEAGKHSPWMTWEDLLRTQPDVILVLPCGFDIERSRREMYALAQRSDWATLKAVRSGQVYLLDGNQYFNRPGPRLVESLEILAEILHPELITQPRHQGSGWQPLGRTPSASELIEGSDFYKDDQGRFVFTRAYHLKRGYCCHSGCRHCPYGTSNP